MDLNFSPKIKEVLTYSRQEASRLGNPFLAPEHLMLGLLNNPDTKAAKILSKFNVDFDYVRDSIEQRIKEKVPLNQNDHLPLLKSTEQILKLVHLEARALKSETVNTLHLLLALLKDSS